MDLTSFLLGAVSLFCILYAIGLWRRGGNWLRAGENSTEPVTENVVTVLKKETDQDAA